MKKIDSAIRNLKQSTPSSKPAKASKSSPATPKAETLNTQTSPAAKSPLKKAAELDSDPESHPSSPAGSREVTGRQSKTASKLTSETPRFDDVSDSEEVSGTKSKPLGALSSASSRVADTAEKPPTLPTDPVEEEQQVNIDSPEAFKAGGEAPEFPSFKDQKPASTTTRSDGSKTATYEQDGVTYTQKTSKDGTVYTTYTQDGVEYSQHSNLAGGGTAVSASSGDGKYFRTIATDAQGKVTDTSNSKITTTDPKTGKPVEQSRVVVRDPDGNEVVTDKVKDPNGGESTLHRTVKPDGRIEETYTYEGEQGKRLRETKQAADGSAETRTEKTANVHGSMNDLLSKAEITEPGAPGDDYLRSTLPNQYPINEAPWPKDQAMDTQVTSVELTTTDTQGNSTLQYAEESYSQTTNNVKLLDESEWNSTFPKGITPDAEGSTVTRTVSSVKVRGEDGQMVESTGASQAFDLQGKRADGSQVSLEMAETWGSDGKSSSTVETKGFTTQEVIDQGTLYDSASDRLIQVEYLGISVAFPGSKPPGVHLEVKGGGEVQSWLGSDPNAPLDVSQTVVRDASGNSVSDTTNFSTLDENGNGKTVTRAEGAGPVAWTYSNLSNNGQDYNRQTVFEGTDISIQEKYKTTGNGQFETSTETFDGGESVGSSNASRVAVGHSELDAMVKSGDLTQAQASVLKTDGPPYYVESFKEQGSTIRDEEGNIQKGPDDSPMQLAFARESVTVSNESGIEVAEQYSKQSDENGQWSGSRLSTTSNPDGNPPIVGFLESGTASSDPNQKDLQVSDFSTVKVDQNGNMLIDGEKLGQFDLHGSNLRTLLREGESFGATDLVSTLGDLSGGAKDWSNPTAASFQLTGNNGAFAKMSQAAGIIGVATGAEDIFSGIGKGDWDTALGGVGDVAGGLSSVAAATSAIASDLGPGSQLALRAGSVSTYLESSNVGKVLGGLGGALDIYFGAKEIFTGDSGWDKAAGGLQVLSGIAAFIPGPGWAISLGLGLVSMLVANGDANETAPLNAEFLNN